jgi:Uncharacterized protein conserved in bacteria (DUF2213)
MPELKRTMLSVQATPDTAAIRTATLFEEEHTVVPCVALVEGVLWPANAPAPELALAEEFGRFPEGWDGRPVVFDHPKVNGTPVSASSPEVLEDISFGQLFNTRLDGVKLKTEIWINNARVENMSENVQDAVKRLKSGDEVVEVSTGLFTMSEVASGEFDGEGFEMIWRNIVPDHLAVLPEGITGACSVEDGCGAPRTNKHYWGEQSDVAVPVMRAAQMNTSAASTNPCECGNTPAECSCEEKKGVFQKIMEAAGDFFQFRGNSKTLGDNDTRTAIQGALSSEEQWFWILTVFDDGDGSGVFVYESFDTGKLFEREFTITDEGAVTIGAEKTEVRPVTQFVAVSPEDGDVSTNNDGSIQENSMKEKDQLVADLIANEATAYSEDDRDWLSTLEESQLAKMSPVEVDGAGSGAGDDDEGAAGDEGAGGDGAIENAAQPPVTTDEYIDAAPEEVKEVLNEGLKMHRSRKDALVTSLLANARNRFTKEQLEGKGITELESIASLASDISFEGAVPTVSSVNDDDAPPPPAQLFDLNPDAASA